MERWFPAIEVVSCQSLEIIVKRICGVLASIAILLLTISVFILYRSRTFETKTIVLLMQY